MHRFCVASVLVFSTLVAQGCGGGPSDAPTLAAVSGTVMVDGKPQEGLTVEFHPDSAAGTTGPMSTALTRADGGFTLATSTGRAGAVVGKHKIAVKCPWSLEGRRNSKDVTADGFGSSPTGEAPPAPAAGSGSDCTIALKFEDPATSTLSAEVPEDGVSDLLLQASSK
ncbi:hypothetical protein Fuma_02314 [Fuerstiella marisgermanici]|uniref:Carboxypeptidase regulatory-like domain-containing protein n=1 Tax=Fuerstiella marisgermanici TaxID=1891926 RepID=A0A1P8WF58_9PLAN|nr:hypothetical protein Fuma_02314 [Fuerstiella marisgermanici]